MSEQRNIPRVDRDGTITLCHKSGDDAPYDLAIESMNEIVKRMRECQEGNKSSVIIALFAEPEDDGTALVHVVQSASGDDLPALLATRAGMFKHLGKVLLREDLAALSDGLTSRLLDNLGGLKG